MKGIATILGLFVLLLCMLPCADVYAASSSNAPHISQSHSDGEHHGVEDDCSPFCVCGCCSTPSVVKFSLQVGTNHVLPVVQRPYPHYRSVYTPSFIHTIWQPPKINA